eukprot:TRINITY_DN5664_c1_g5_i1.p1 TRINITY_DN5664_c1_g5~~TRINITY_DN5664_c1_g5_i1.p1  ORF type:complete len:344 (-),score=49.10 TRINITY_DN5664_c1_g5_i1:21-1052(-)
MTILEDSSLSQGSSSSDKNYAVINCFDPLDECLRTATLALLFTITLILCLVQVFRIIKNTRRYFSYQLIVLYIAIIECILAAIHWYFISSTSLIFLVIYCRDIELAVVTYFFIQSALIHFEAKNLKKIVLWPLYIFLFLILTAATIFGICVDLFDLYVDRDCGNPAFIILSGITLLNASVFFITGIIITVKYNRMNISSTILKQKKLILWSLIFTNFIVALISFTWDVTDIIHENISKSCVFFSDTSVVENVLEFCERFIDIIIPLWCLIITFEIEAKRTKEIKDESHELFDNIEQNQETFSKHYNEYQTFVSESNTYSTYPNINSEYSVVDSSDDSEEDEGY